MVKTKILPAYADECCGREGVKVHLYLQILVLTLLLHSCRGGMSNRGPGDFNIDRTANTDPCANQTSPSPQCPQEEQAKQEGEEEEANEAEEDDNPAGSGASASGPPQLTVYQDGTWGSITVNPLTMKKDEEAQLRMTFTAAKAIAQDNTPINLQVDFPHPNTGFKLNKVETSPAAAKDFFKRDPYVFTSSTTNKATAKIMTMAEGAQFTLTFTITPQQDFEFKAKSSNNRYFKNSRGELPQLSVYTGSTAPVVMYDTSPVYTSGKLEMRLKPWPHKAPKDTDTELTMTFTAVTDLERRAITQNGQLTHDVPIGISPYNAVSTYEVKSVSTQTYFKDSRKPHCSIITNCQLKIVEMRKGENFILKLTVNATKNFSIGYSNGTGTPLRKKPDGINPELDGERPQVKVE